MCKVIYYKIVIKEIIKNLSEKNLKIKKSEWNIKKKPTKVFK